MKPYPVSSSVAPDFVTSDTHLGHARIFEEGYCPGRQQWAGAPFTGVGTHDQAITAAWNDAVGHDDKKVVLHLGDFAFGPRGSAAVYRRRLRGRVWLVLGNHDRSAPQMREAGFEVVAKRLAFDCAHGRVVCRHRPKDFTADDVAEADLLLHGHLHGEPLGDSVLDAARPKCRDVGVDMYGPAPVPLCVVDQRQEPRYPPRRSPP